MNMEAKFAIHVLTAAALTLLSTLALADDESSARTGTDAPVYGDSADIPAHDPSVRRPQTSTSEDVNVRQEPSGPEIAPGAERDALVPIPEDNDGRIDPQ